MKQSVAVLKWQMSQCFVITWTEENGENWAFLPLALVPAPLWNSWQPRHRIVTALKILRRLLRYDPNKLFVVGLVAFS